LGPRSMREPTELLPVDGDAKAVGENLYAKPKGRTRPRSEGIPRDALLLAPRAFEERVQDDLLLVRSGVEMEEDVAAPITPVDGERPVRTWALSTELEPVWDGEAARIVGDGERGHCASQADGKAFSTLL